MLNNEEEPAFCTVDCVIVLVPDARFNVLKVAIASKEPPEFCWSVPPLSVSDAVAGIRARAARGFNPASLSRSVPKFTVTELVLPRVPES